MKITRNAKFWGLKFSPEFMEDYKKTVSIMNKILSYLRSKLQSGEIVKIDRFKIYHSDDTEYTAAVYNKKFLHDLYDVEKKWSMKRQMLFYCMERYLGYSNRNNNQKIPTIVIKENKSFYYKESSFITVDLENSKLIVKTLYGERDVPFSYSLKTEHMKKKKGKKKLTTGGNFIINQGAFVAMVKFVKEPLYVPENVLGNDQNKTRSDWLVFNDGSKITPLPIVAKLMDDIRDLNKLLDKDKKKEVSKRLLRTKARRKIRYQWKEHHRKLKVEITKVASYICDKAVKNKSLLCIDSVKTGQRNGTFGQDHLIEILQTMCENRGTPFYVVPCKNTSRRCSLCGYTKEENRIDTSNFHCQKCGHQCDAQQNGANNVAYQGNRLFEAGVPYGNWARRSVDKLVEKYSQQQSSVVTSEAS